MKPKEAAIDSAATPSIALLGATIVAAMAFFPIYTAKSDAGEYAQTLFSVVGISLILSWLISMTMTPLNCIAFLKPPENGEGDGDPYDTGFFRTYRRVLEAAIRGRVITIGEMVVLLIAAVIGFTNVPQQFFPDSTRTQFMIDYWAPEGTPIQEVARNLKPIEDQLLADPRVKEIVAFMGAGGPRFYLPVDPELPYPSYAQFIVNTHDFVGLNELVADNGLDNIPFEKQLSELVYFSFVTLTTLGYGDVSPAHPFARWLAQAEAVFGQLYIAILIATLVGKWIARETSDGNMEEESLD